MLIEQKWIRELDEDDLLLAEYKSSRCKFCKGEASKNVEYRDGKVSVCDSHVKMAKAMLNKKGYRGTRVTEMKKTVITPGGRVGNDRSTGSRSNGENWVERSRSGTLPRYIRIVRNGLMKDGMPEGRATALAVGAMKRWARGGGNVSPKVQAAAAKALAQWEAMKAAAKAKSAAKSLDEMFDAILGSVEHKEYDDAG